MEGARSSLRWLRLHAARADIAPLVSSELFGLRRGATRTGREPLPCNRYLNL